MVAQVEIQEFVKREVRNPLVVVGFPTVGAVGAIAAQYLAQSLSLELVGRVFSPDIPPVVTIRDGEVLPAFRVYAGNEVCGQDGECDQLLLVTSDFPPPERVLWSLAGEILRWSGSVKARLVVSLEGVVHETENPVPQVWGAATSPAGLQVLEKKSIPAFEQGVVGGISAAILTLARGREVGALCLLAEAHPEIPDARAAASLIGAVSRLTPRLKIDPAPLLREAEQIEAAMKKSQTRFEAQRQRQPEAASAMFA